MQCPKCHQRVVEGAKRCPACGASAKVPFLGRFLRLVISDEALQKLNQKAAVPSTPPPGVKEGEFYLVVGSVLVQARDKVLVSGRVDGTGEFRPGDHASVTLSDKTIKTCEVLQFNKLGEALGLDFFAPFASLQLGGIDAREIKVGDVIKKV